MTAGSWLVSTSLADPSGITAVAVALITTFGSVLVAIVGAFALSLRRRWANVEEDDPPQLAPATPDQAYRDALQRLAALTIFLEVRGYKTKRILTGDEADVEAR